MIVNVHTGCHLDLCLENILLSNYRFVKQTDGTFKIDPDICIKLCDFGVAEVFRINKTSNDNNNDIDSYFNCSKQGLSLDNESKLEPKIFNDIGKYNARKADIWSLGMVLFECMTGKPLYEPYDIWSENNLFNGYWSLNDGKLKEYLLKNNLLKYFNSDSLSLLLCQLLELNESFRISADNIIKHKWFGLYFKTFGKRVLQKSQSQQKSLLKQKKKMLHFPYYRFVEW